MNSLNLTKNSLPAETSKDGFYAVLDLSFILLVCEGQSVI